MLKQNIEIGIVLSLIILFIGCHNNEIGRSQENKSPVPLILTGNGKSKYQIIIPDDINDKKFAEAINETAKLLRDCIKDASAAELPVVRECNADKKLPGIYIGHTAFTEKLDLDFRKLGIWGCINKAYGDNIVLAGKDIIETKRVSYGSIKAVIVFMENNMGVRFILPGKNGISVPRMERITVPPDLNYMTSPKITYCAPGTEFFYDIANNFYDQSSIGYRSYFGHSYYKMLPAAKYGKTNPEYFRFAEGKRVTAGNHLCISNPNVQEILYQALLDEFDKGYDMVELSATDGYLPCECPDCKKMYGVNSSGEKVWLMHCKMAERLQKDRPEKKVLLVAYPPCSNPPESFKVFPDNVVIQTSRHNPEGFAQWKDYKVPGGFMVYVYHWGYYQKPGMTPQRSPSFLENQVRLFYDNKVSGIFRCGFGGLFGLEGPAYYTYGRLLVNPGKKGDDYADEFYRSAYGKSYLPMRKFFNTLHSKLELYAHLMPKQKDTYSYKTAMGPREQMLANNPSALLGYIYTPDLLKTLSMCLKEAGKINDDPVIAGRLALVEHDFEYVKRTAEVIILYNAYCIRPDWKNFDALAEAINTRNELIDSYYDSEGKMKKLPEWPDIRPFQNASKPIVMLNGRNSAVLGSPFTWNIEAIRKSGVLPGASGKSIKILKANGVVNLNGNPETGEWKNASWNSLSAQTGDWKYNARFKMLYDEENIYCVVETEVPKDGKYFSMGHDNGNWTQEDVEFFIAPFAEKEKYYHLVFNPVDNSYYDARRGFFTDPLDPRTGQADNTWDCKNFEYKNLFNNTGDGWTFMVKIPFVSLEACKPEKGSKWHMNIGRAHPIKVSGGSRYNAQTALWSLNTETPYFHNPDAFGEIVFE